jgi:hypothetical protein
MYGSVREAISDDRPYRDRQPSTEDVLRELIENTCAIRLR